MLVWSVFKTFQLSYDIHLLLDYSIFSAYNDCIEFVWTFPHGRGVVSTFPSEFPFSNKSIIAF